MCRPQLLFLLGVLGFCAAQDGGGPATNANSTTSATCDGSTADFCVRTCCPSGQNDIRPERVCSASTLRWEPSFLCANVSLEVVGGPIEECGPNKDPKTFIQHQDPSLQFMLRSSGELTIHTSKEVYDLGHDYCFNNIEHKGILYESVRSCVPKEFPQVPGLVNIDNVSEVSFRKCCPVGQMFTVNTEKQSFVCVNSSADWLPDVLHGDPTELVQLPPEKARIEAGGEFKCPINTEPQYLHSAQNAFFLKADSRLLITNYDATIEPDHFCLDLFRSSSSNPQRIGHVCYDEAEKHTKQQFEQLCPEGVCARKCCAPHFILFNTKCIPATEKEWQPTFHEKEQVVSAPVNYTLLHGRSECDGHSFIFSSRVGDKDVPFLQADGEIQVTKLNIAFKAHQCCLEYEMYYDEEKQENSVVETALCCQPKDWEAITIQYVNGTLLTISAICLFVMLAIYMLVPKLRNIHGKCLMSHAAALFIAFFLTVFNQVIGVDLGPGCDALGLMMYYSFIAALFWLNVMSFDIWWTFAHLRTQAPSPRSLRNRFIRHSLYAWGVPLLMTLLLAFLNYASDETIPKGVIVRPQLGERKCFLSGKLQELYYFYVPIFIITGVNIVFFAATAWTLYQADKSSRILKRKRTARDRLKVYINLFIIMEVSWIAECLSTQIGPIQAWYFTDIINASQGLLIFLLFIVRSSTRQTIRERFVELSKHGLLNRVARKVHPAGNAGDNARTSMPTKTTTATTSSSAARKSSEAEAYKMAEKNTPSEPEKNGDAGEDDVTTSGLAPAPHDSAC